jgi:hypothetical protein
MDESGRLLARYANWFNIGHNDFEFVLDFGQDHQEGEPLVHTRIVVGPSYAQVFAMLLNQSIQQWEGEFGPIPRVGGERPPK